jgi:hypothetical protein
MRTDFISAPIRYLIFSAVGKGMYSARADGTGQPQPLTQSKNFQVPSSITRDGKLTAGKGEPFLKSQAADFFYPMFSPDGHWIAYASNLSGEDEVYVRAFPAPASGRGGQWQMSGGGARMAIWSRAEHEVTFLFNFFDELRRRVPAAGK